MLFLCFRIILKNLLNHRAFTQILQAGARAHINIALELVMCRALKNSGFRVPEINPSKKWIEHNLNKDFLHFCYSTYLTIFQIFRSSASRIYACMHTLLWKIIKFWGEMKKFLVQFNWRSILLHGATRTRNIRPNSKSSARLSKV